ncbi:MAG: class I SAM-dependent methyltransferase [Chlamydiae bacterium]|nr:class I SAM-dependent methyltransferase [Chlamydiota bacterium]
MSQQKENSSWESVSGWYNKVVGSKGHYYHENVILPKVAYILSQHVSKQSSLLDLACGQGILARSIPKEIEYLGIDAAASLIQSAKRLSKNKLHHFQVADLTNTLELTKNNFDACTIILALQNISNPLQVMRNAARHVKKDGVFILILNHPCFRIPRQTSWQIDEPKKIQYRRVDLYMSPLTIPIQAHPSQGEESVNTWSYHHNLSDYSKMLKEAGFVIDSLDEWCSDKQSTGGKAKMENRSREEIPMFLSIIAKKL